MALEQSRLMETIDIVAIIIMAYVFLLIPILWNGVVISKVGG